MLVLLKHLEQAEHYVVQAEKIIARQREMIQGMERAGYSTDAARELLRRFEATRDAFVAHRDLIRKEIEEAR